MSFSITPASGFPPQASDEFPNYIQFQNQGADLGLPNVDTVNFGRNLTATRGTGENANVVTVVAETFVWAEAANDYLLSSDDLGNGVKTTHNSGPVIVTVPGDTELGIDGEDVSVLIMQAGAGSVSVVGQSGVTVNVRSALLPETAGQYAVLSLIHTGADEWVLCGDLGAP
jgi:hypothetical protein